MMQWHRFVIDDRNDYAAGVGWLAFKERLRAAYRDAGYVHGVRAYRQGWNDYLLSPEAADLCMSSAELQGFWQYLSPLEAVPVVRERNAVLL